MLLVRYVLRPTTGYGRDVDVHLPAQRRRGDVDVRRNCRGSFPTRGNRERGYVMPLSPPKLDSKEEHFRVASYIEG